MAGPNVCPDHNGAVPWRHTRSFDAAGELAICLFVCVQEEGGGREGGTILGTTPRAKAAGFLA